jgi:hypothetical protein
MTSLHRRALAAGLLATPFLATATRAQQVLEQLREPGPVTLTDKQVAQRFTASPAPAGAPGTWQARANLPLPRSEMAWATAGGCM